MRILHILDHSLPLHSGYTFRSQNLFRMQKARGWDIAVLTSPKHQESWKGAWEMKEVIEEVTYFRTQPGEQFRIAGIKEAHLMSSLTARLKEVCSTIGPDIIHAHSPILNAIPALRVGKLFGVPVVYEIRAFWEDAAVDHGSYSENSWKYHVIRFMETRICTRVQHVITICDGLRQDLIARGIPSAKISIVGNGVDLEHFDEQPPDMFLANQWAINKRKVLAFLGSFYKYEGLDLLIRAFKAVLNEGENCALILAGGGEMEESLRHQVRQLGLEDSVIIPGRIAHERIPNVYALADIMVYPRYAMRLTNLVTPLKPLEAMAAGKAVIASDVGGHRELIRDRETGLLFPAGNVVELANRIKELLNNHQLRNSLAHRAREQVRQERCWEKTTAVYEDIYRQALSAH